MFVGGGGGGGGCQGKGVRCSSKLKYSLALLLSHVICPDTHSVRGGAGWRGCLPMVLGVNTSPGQTTSLGRHPLWTDTRQADTTPGQTRPLPSTAGYGQQAGGKHPIGMHSCVNVFFFCFSAQRLSTTTRLRVTSGFTSRATGWSSGCSGASSPPPVNSTSPTSHSINKPVPLL